MMQYSTMWLECLRVCRAQVICAGSLDTFQIFVWATKTGRLLDVLAAHEAPVVALAFSPAQPLLASGSWDKTVRTWDVFRCSAAVPLSPISESCPWASRHLDPVDDLCERCCVVWLGHTACTTHV